MHMVVSVICKQLLEKLTQVGLGSKSYGLHKVQYGGATAAANNGVPDRYFK